MQIKEILGLYRVPASSQYAMKDASEYFKPDEMVLRRLIEYSWAFHIIIDDLKSNSSKRIRQTMLPSSFTTPILRHVRSVACKDKATKQNGCAKWPSNTISEKQSKWDRITYTVDQDYLCGGCSNPYATHRELIEEFHLATARDSFDEKTWRRYLNEEYAMPVIQFRRVIANAFRCNWLNRYELLTLWNETDELELTKKTLAKLCERMSERKDFDLFVSFNLSREKLIKFAYEFMAEFKKQRELLHAESIKRLDLLLRDPDPTITPDNRKLYEELILENMSNG